MIDEHFLTEVGSKFGITGPPITKAEIDAALPSSFPGKDDVIRFYLRNNGGSRTRQGGTFYCRIPGHQVTRDHLDKIRVEGFYAIHRNPEEKVLGFLSMLKKHALFSKKCNRYPELKAFVEHNMPLAFDHCGNDFWIDVNSGHVHYMLADAMKDGPIDIAPSFQEFVAKFWIDAPAFEPDDRPK